MKSKRPSYQKCSDDTGVTIGPIFKFPAVCIVITHKTLWYTSINSDPVIIYFKASAVASKT